MHTVWNACNDARNPRGFAVTLMNFAMFLPINGSNSVGRPGPFRSLSRTLSRRISDLQQILQHPQIRNYYFHERIHDGKQTFEDLWNELETLRTKSEQEWIGPKDGIFRSTATFRKKKGPSAVQIFMIRETSALFRMNGILRHDAVADLVSVVLNLRKPIDRNQVLKLCRDLPRPF